MVLLQSVFHIEELHCEIKIDDLVALSRCFD